MQENTDKPMTSNQPYLLRAFFDWILDNQLTPYMVVQADYPNVLVPTQFVNNGQIVLNVSPSACVSFNMDLDWVEFQARFSGQAMNVSFPCNAVVAIYAKENGAGTVFEVPEPTLEKTTPILKQTGKHLDKENEVKGELKPNEPKLSSVETSSLPERTKSDNKKKKKPGLRVIK